MTLLSTLRLKLECALTLMYVTTVRRKGLLVLLKLEIDCDVAHESAMKKHCVI